MVYILVNEVLTDLMVLELLALISARGMEIRGMGISPGNGDKSVILTKSVS